MTRALQNGGTNQDAIWSRGVYGMGTAESRRILGYGYEYCGNTAGMDLTTAGFRQDGFYYGGNPAGMH